MKKLRQLDFIVEALSALFVYGWLVYLRVSSTKSIFLESGGTSLTETVMVVFALTLLLYVVLRYIYEEYAWRNNIKKTVIKRNLEEK